ncbi:Hyaluronate lyase [Rhizoctonia solani]|uniref:Hyaluronate lyase n=1 Tax=Rhizoctonia solani TaxID=456999 RepID=A0A0K6G522_9AGAM|nr:Hyaluronate lyase [Rhizoctonia solani]
MSGSAGAVRTQSTGGQRATPLFRGSGCHYCRTRKVKCDAEKPFCTRCVSQNTTDKCKYDQVKKSKFTLLKEENARLKERIAHLERASGKLASDLEDIKEPPSSAFSRISLEEEDDYDGHEQDQEVNVDAREDQIYTGSGPHPVQPQQQPTHGVRPDYFPMEPAQPPRLDHYPRPPPEDFQTAHHFGQYQQQPFHDPYPQLVYQGSYYPQGSTSNAHHHPEYVQVGGRVHSVPYTPQVQTGLLPEVHTWPPTPTDPVPLSATTSGFTPSPQSNRWALPPQMSPEMTPESPNGLYVSTNYPQGANFRDDGRYVGGAMPSYNAYQGAPIQAPAACRRPVPSPPARDQDMVDEYLRRWRIQSRESIENQYAQTISDSRELVGNWWEKDDLSVADRNAMLELFLPFRKQAGLEVFLPEFLASLHHPPERRPHPGFMWMIYSFAAFFSGDPELKAQVGAFMERARRNLEESFANGDRLFDYVRGQTLYASLLYMSGRVNEGFMATSSACNAAILCGLHKITSAAVGPRVQARERPGYRIKQIEFQLEPAVSPREHGERITAFWQLILVDHSAAATTGSLAMFRDDGDERSRVETVFPRPLEEYMNGGAYQVPYATLGDVFTSKEIPKVPDTVLTMQVKATAILERAARLATKWGRGEHISFTDPSKYSDEYHIIVGAIQHFKSYLPGLRPQPGNSADSNLFLTSNGLVFERLFPHFMLWDAEIQLYTVFEDAEAHNMYLNAARQIRYLTSQLTDKEIEQLGVLLGHCFASASAVLSNELTLYTESGDLQGAQYLAQELNVIRHAQEVLAANHFLAAVESGPTDSRARRFPVAYP